MAEADDLDYKRDYPRETVRAKARILVDEQWHDCLITNISSVGARLYLRMSVATDQKIRIQIGEFGQYDATVIWCYGDETGLKFEQDPEVMSNLMMALAS